MGLPRIGQAYNAGGGSATASSVYSPATKVVAPVGYAHKADYYTSGNTADVQINLAIIAVNTLGGGKVKLVGYSASNPPIITNKILPLSNVTLEGEGMFVTTIKKDPSTVIANSIEINNVSHVTIRDLGVIGNVSSLGLVDGRGVHSDTATDVRIERVYAIDNREGFQSQNCTDLTYINCYADSNYEWNFYTYAGTRVKALYNQSFNAKAGTLEGFGMAFYNSNLYCEAIGNYVYNPAHNGIQMNAGHASADVLGMICRDNLVIKSGHYGIMVTNDGDVVYIRGASVDNNRVYQSTLKNLYVVNGRNVSIFGNKLDGSLGDGLAYENCVDCVSRDNVVTNNNRGIRVIGSGMVLAYDISSNNTNADVLPTGTIILGPNLYTLSTISGGTLTDSSGVVSGTTITTNADPALASSAQVRNLYSTLIIPSTNTQTYSSGTGLIGVRGEVQYLGSGTVSHINAGYFANFIGTNSTTVSNSNAVQVVPAINSGTPIGTVSTARGVLISNSSLGSGPMTITTQIGVDIAALTSGLTDIGIRIAKADTYSLQLSDTSGLSAGGITFGTDANLYRSAANILKTDDYFIASGGVRGTDFSTQFAFMGA